MKKIVLLVPVLIISLLLVMLVGATTPQPLVEYNFNFPSGNLITGAYYEINITNPSSTVLNNYQIRINPTDIGGLRSDKESLNITYGTTTLSYWIQPYVNGTPKWLWIKVPQIPANTQITIRLIKSSGFSPNGENTFLFFDNFSGTTLNTSKWTEIVANSVTVNNGLNITSNSNYGWAYPFIVSTKTFNNFRLITSVSELSAGALGDIDFGLFNTSAYYNVQHETRTGAGNDDDWIKTNITTHTYIYDGRYQWNAGEWVDYNIKVNGSYVTAFRVSETNSSRSAIANFTDTVNPLPTTNRKIGFSADAIANTVFSVKWVAVANYSLVPLTITVNYRVVNGTTNPQTTIVDSSGNGYDATLYGYNYYNLLLQNLTGDQVTSNGYNGSYGFEKDSSASSFSATTHLTISNDKDWTFATWVKEIGIPSTNLPNAIIIGANSGYNGIGLIGVPSGSDPSHYFGFVIGTRSSSGVVFEGDYYPYDTWHYIAGTYNHSTGELQYYEDGKLIKTGTGVTDFGNWTLHVGGLISGNDNTVDFIISQARVWDRILNQSEIQREMYSKEPVDPDGLVANYDFRHYDSSYVYDSKQIGQGFSNTTGALNLFGGQYGQTSSTASITTNVTITGWVKNNGNSPNDDTWAQIKNLYIGNTHTHIDAIQGYITTEGGGGYFRLGDSSVNLYNNKWHFIVVEYNGTNVIGYVDNIKLKTYDGLYPTMNGSITGTSPFTIGSRVDGSYHFTGQLSNIRLYNVSLTPHEIFTMYQNESIFPLSTYTSNPVDIPFIINSPFNYTFNSHIKLVRTDNNGVVRDYSQSYSSNIFHTLSFNDLPAGHYNLSINSSYGTGANGTWVYKSVTFNVDRVITINVRTPDNQVTSTALNITTNQGQTLSLTDTTGQYMIHLLNYPNLVMNSTTPATQYNFILTKSNYQPVIWQYNNSIYNNLTYNKTIYPYEWFYVYDSFDDSPINVFNISFTHNNITYYKASSTTGYFMIPLNELQYGINTINVTSYLFNTNITTMDIEPSSVFNKSIYLNEKRIKLTVKNELTGDIITNYTATFDNDTSLFYAPNFGKVDNTTGSWQDPNNAVDNNLDTYAYADGSVFDSTMFGTISYIDTMRLNSSTEQIYLKYVMASGTNLYHTVAVYFYNYLTQTYDQKYYLDETSGGQYGSLGSQTATINLSSNYLVNNTIKYKVYVENGWDTNTGDKALPVSLYYLGPLYDINKSLKISYFRLPKNLNKITVSSSNYIPRHYLLTPNSNYDLTASLLPYNSGVYYTFYVYNSASQPIQGAQVNLEKLINGKWVMISSQLTDASGKAVVYLDVTNPQYKLTVEDQGYVDIHTDLAIDVNNPLTYIVLQSSGENGSNQIHFITPLTNISYQYIPNASLNTSLNFSLSLYSSNNDLAYFGFYVYNTTSSQFKLLDTIKTTDQPSGGQLSWYTNTTGSYEIIPFFKKGNNTEVQLSPIDYVVAGNSGVTGIDLSDWMPTNVWWLIIVFVEIALMIFIGRFTMKGAGIVGVIVMILMVIIYPVPLLGINPWLIVTLTGILEIFGLMI